MALTAIGRPLSIAPWMLREIASSCGGASPHARMVRSDLAFLGIPEMVNMSGVDDDDPAWDPIIAAYRTLLTDASPRAATRILAHIQRSPSMDDTLYGSILVDPITRGVVEAMGNSLAGLVMMTRSHEDMALQVGDDLSGGTQSVAIDIDDVKHEGEVLPFLTMAMELGDGVHLEAGRLEITLDIPETMLTILPGMRLADFISHPLLDPHDTRIRSWDGISLHLDYDGMATSAFA